METPKRKKLSGEIIASTMGSQDTKSGSYEPKQKVEGKGQRDGKGSSTGGQGDQDGAKMARVGRDVSKGSHWRKALEDLTVNLVAGRRQPLVFRA